MATKLVIVESPAKARTISGYLGKEYEVEASVGHIRDLPLNGKKLPEAQRGQWWSEYAVDVDHGFEPIYEVPPEKAAQVKRLREALKGKDTLVLATDEDREGESISWHLLQVLKPGKSVAVKRIAFHEITKTAVLEALQNPREVDACLVEAQETRRVLDRLYGYTLSPVLWSRVMRNLSAGRVQTPAVKLIVERELARRAFRGAEYWDLKAQLRTEDGSFSATLREVDGVRVASGADFDETTGALKTGLKEPRLHVDEARAGELLQAARAATSWTVSKLTEAEGVENPAAPFMTTTLQQDANRKFGFSADRTMRIAQSLYEGVEIGGGAVGLITYMRTDSLTLASSAIAALRELIGREYADCLPDKPRAYASKVRNAQEAHEAIRPTDAARRPADVRARLNVDQYKLYDLIWKRTVASQMKSARVLRTEAEILAAGGGPKLGFAASGKQVLFDGFRRVYTEGAEDAEEGSGESRLPRLAKGAALVAELIAPESHATRPPARFTDASLIKTLEANGIGRPSTYASTIATIVDRGYVRKEARQLIPTFKAFLAMDVLESNFEEFTSLDFTRRMDDRLDEIAEGKADSRAYLGAFFLGESGLKTVVDGRKREIPYPSFKVGEHPESGEEIVVRIGTNGDPFLQLGPRENKRFANVPEDLAPADLSVAAALELLSNSKPEAESVGIHPGTGRRLLLRNRQGYYLEVERTPEELEAKLKPTWISLPPGVHPSALAAGELDAVCALPREIGANPETGAPVLFKLGKYGGYIESGSERRTLEDWRAGLSISLEAAMELLKQPKFQTRRAPAAALAEFGELEGAAGPVRILAGRFGPYVTDGEVNATLPRGLDPAAVTAEKAAELLAIKRAAGPSTGPKRGGRRGAPAAKAGAKRAPAAKAGAKRAPAAKAGAKRPRKK